jgi:hypothetical protein
MFSKELFVLCRIYLLYIKKNLNGNSSVGEVWRTLSTVKQLVIFILLATGLIRVFDAKVH